MNHRPYLLICLLVAVACAGCSRRGLTLRESSDSVATATLVGDARDRAVRPTLRITARMYDDAIGTAAGGGPVIVTDSRASGAGESPDWAGTFAFGPAPLSQPAARYALRGGSLSEAASTMVGRHGDRLFVRGRGRFRRLLGVTPGGQYRGEDVEAEFAGVIARTPSILRGDWDRVFDTEANAPQAGGEIMSFHAVAEDGTVLVADPASRPGSLELDVFSIEALDAR